MIGTNGGYLTPMLLIMGVSAANELYNTRNPLDCVKPLVAGGLATGLLALMNNVPGFSGVTQGIAWVAFIGLLVAPIQNPSPAENLLKITGGLQ